MTITQDLIKNSQPYWDEYIKHEFIQKLAKGTTGRVQKSNMSIYGFKKRNADYFIFNKTNTIQQSDMFG